MNENTNFLFQNKRMFIFVLATVSILMVPLVAMQFSEEVQWSAFDFAVLGVLLLGAGLAFELAVRGVRNIKHRSVVGAVVAIALLLVWVELAVGIFGSPVAGS